MEKVKFPYVNLSIMLKTTCKTTHAQKCVDYYSIDELYKTLSGIENYELGGEYDPKLGFIIDPYTTHFDVEQHRAYTKLNTNSNTRIVFHSHPFNHEDTNYPSIEDLDMCRMYPKLIFLIITETGVYVMSALKSYISIDLISSYYRNMQPETSGCEWNYKEINESFLANKGFIKEKIEKHGLFVYFIQIKMLNKKSLNIVITDSFKQKEKKLQ